MQSGSGWRVTASVGLGRCVRRIGVLVLGLALSGCMGAGQIAGLSERRVTVAVESVEGAPPAVVHRFVTLLNDEAAARNIIVVSPNEANYRVRGYLAAQRAEGAATSVSWVLDVYGPDRQRVVRFSGEQKATGPTWAWAQGDDETLRRMARMGTERLAAFVGAAPSVTAAAMTPSAGGTTAQHDALRLAGRLDTGGLGDFPHLARGAGAHRHACRRLRPGGRRPLTPASDPARVAPKRSPNQLNLRDKARRRPALVLPASAPPCYQGAANVPVPTTSAQGVARRQACGPITEPSSSSPATRIPRWPTRSPPISPPL